VVTLTRAVTTASLNLLPLRHQMGVTIPRA
jgi:hypothetical protein